VGARVAEGDDVTVRTDAQKGGSPQLDQEIVVLLKWELEIDGLALGHVGGAGDTQPRIGLGNSADICGNGVYRLGYSHRKRKDAQCAADSHGRFEEVSSRG